VPFQYLSLLLLLTYNIKYICFVDNFLVYFKKINETIIVDLNEEGQNNYSKSIRQY
jgi:hypothetical protein